MMEQVVKQLKEQLVEFQRLITKVEGLQHGWKANAARLRKLSLDMSKTFKIFRILSVAESKKD